MSLLLKDRNGKYFPVIDERLNKFYEHSKEYSKDLIWITGVKKSILEEIGMTIYNITRNKASSYFYYSYLVNENEFMKYISKSEPPIVMERS